MATRHNTCINPSLSVDNAGWGGNGTAPVRTAVSGFDRGFAARYTDGSFIRTQYGAATPALTYTVSLYLRFATFAVNGHIYIEWQDGSHGALSYTSADYSATFNAVTRVTVSGAAPANTAFAAIIIDGDSFSANTLDVTMVLIEPVADLDDYFDGDTAGAGWVGTAGASASTYVDTVSATGDIILPALEASGAATVTNSGSGTITLPPIAAAGTAAAISTATSEITLPALTAAGTGTARITATGTVTLPALTAEPAPSSLTALGAVLIDDALGGTLYA